MAFPYFNPNPNLANVAGQGFFRLKQGLSSAGDIFESEQGAHAFALGPDSDISNVTIGYVDSQSRPPYSSQTSPAETNLSTLSITPQRAFAANIPAVNNDTQYAPSGVPGRILIWPTEIYDATFLPPGFDAVADRLIRENPVIDILQFFSPPPILQPARADKTYYYDELPFGTSQICYVLIPYYGRRYASIWIQNTSTAGHDLNMTITGINFRQSETSPNIVPLWTYATGNEDPEISNVRSMVLGSGFNALTQPTREVTNAGAVTAPNTTQNAGLFDYLLIEVDGDTDVANTPNGSLRVTVSDQIGRTSL